jgi:lipid II:glycine glycyltransferase (peptidoglycan interpeptide bridge formation enzyme)
MSAQGAPALGVKRIDEAGRTAWDAYVADAPRGDVLHSWAWGEVAAWRGEPPTRLGLYDADGALCGAAQVLVRPTALGRTVLYVPHGPLWDPALPGALGALLDAITAVAREASGIVVKLDPRGDGLGPDELGSLRAELAGRGLRQARQFLQAPITQVVELAGGPEVIRGSWQQLARRNVARAVREGVTTRVVRDGDAAAIAAFQRVHAETARRGGFAARSGAFLERLAAAFAPGGGWYLSLAEKDGRTIGGMVGLRFGDRAYYLYGGSSGDPADRDARPGYATMAGLITALAEDGVRTLDMWGIADGGAEERGVAARERTSGTDEQQSWGGFSFFKQRFGGTEVHHAETWDLVVSPGWYAIRGLAERARLAMARQ